MKNPPEGGTFLGSPVEYSSVLENQIPDNRPLVLVMTGFTPMPSLEHALKYYLGNVVKKEIVSIDVLGKEALVKFTEPKGAHCVKPAQQTMKYHVWFCLLPYM